MTNAATFWLVTGLMSTTFAAAQHTPHDVATALANAGFVLEPVRTIERTLLDTFDGRLHTAGLRLESRVGHATELVLSGVDTATAVLLVAAAPSVTDQLPAGPFRRRVAEAAEDRALLAVVRVRTRCTSASRRDADGKIVAAATIWEQLSIDGHDGLTMVPCTVEVETLRGFEKHARKTFATLAGLGLAQLDHDTLAEAARVAQIHIGGYPGPSDIVLDPAMLAIDGCCEVLTGLANTIAANWQGTIDETDIEFLHDLRIAVRRTRTVLGEAKKVLPSHMLSKARTEFAQLGSVTGPSRDLDVYIVEWPTYTDGLAPDIVSALEPVRALLRQRQIAAHRELNDALRAPATTAFVTQWRLWLAGPIDDGDEPAPAAHDPLIDVVAKRIMSAHTRLVKAGRLIRSDTPAEHVHDLRKDAKKLRYLIECFGSVLSEKPRKTFVRRLKVLQDNLGVHQDAEVHVATLREIADELHERGERSATMLAVGQLTERIDQRRRAARAEFAERFAAYDIDDTRDDLERALGRGPR